MSIERQERELRHLDTIYKAMKSLDRALDAAYRDGRANRCEFPDELDGMASVLDGMIEKVELRSDKVNDQINAYEDALQREHNRAHREMAA